MLKWLSGILATVLSGWILHDRMLHRLRSWSWHFFNSDIWHRSVVTQLRCGEIISQGFVANLLVNLTVKEVWKPVNIWRRYGQYRSALFFDSQCINNSISRTAAILKSWKIAVCRPQFGPIRPNSARWRTWGLVSVVTVEILSVKMQDGRINENC